MAAWRLCLHLVVLWAAVSQSVANSVDLEQAVMFNGTGPREDFFGYKVHLFQSGTEKGIVVSAPLQNNGSGGIFMCNHTSSDCDPFTLPKASLANEDTDFVKGVGMSVAVRTKPSLQFTACSPAWAHECDGTPYYNSICYQWGKTEPVSNFTSAFKECEKQEVDLVFLFDGSLSMKTEDFNKNKDFIETVMKSMENTSIQFAAAQFSSNVQTVFTFKDFREKRALQKLKDEKHMKSLTNTHKAMRFVLEKLFENQASGCQPKATKVLVIITDGNPSDKGEPIIKKYKDKHIIRFVIAVGNDINMAVLQKLASEPNNTFFIQDYAGLSGLLKDLETKIFNIEGSSDDLAQVFENELSQSGMSAAYAEDSLVVGSVGSNDSRGSLHQIEDRSSPDLEITDPDIEKSSYMGYSVAVGKNNGVAMYFAGAPRYKHKGQVIVFSQSGNDWSVKQRVNGDQIGSYFGGELCAVDIDSDGSTDFLMVGAPLYYHPQIEGLMYVYALAEENQLVSVLNVSESRQGRFSSSIASLRDLNGDGLQDLAVGAPLEDDRTGVVYIYLGHGDKGIRSDYYQRITAKSLSESLRQFGVKIDGTSDTDGLTDIVVGSYGQVVLLKSRPVFNVSAHLSFSPSEISILQFDCIDQQGGPLPLINMSLCFQMNEQTKSTTDRMATGLKLEYDLGLDPERQRSRAFLAANDSSLRRVRTVVHLNNPRTCKIYTMYMPRCVMDTLTPVGIQMNFSQAENHQPYGVLNIDSKTEASLKVPFQRLCKGDDCVADLHMDFDFTSAEMVVFTSKNNLFLKLALSNWGDDSYNTSLRFQYPLGISHSKLTEIPPQRKTLTNCPENKDALDYTICDVSPPVFRSNKSAIFNVSFTFIEDSLNWGDFITMTIIAHSDNGDSGNGTMGSTFKDYSVTKSLPVVFAVGLAVAFPPTISTTYVSYSLEDKGPKTLKHVYKVANTRPVPLPVSVSFIFPTKPEENFRITDPTISHKKEDNATINCTEPHSVVTQNCSLKESCLKIECSIPMLKKYDYILFTLTVKAALDLSPSEYTFSELRFPRTFKTSAEITYNKTRYRQFGDDQKQLDYFPRQQGKTTAELIIPIHLPMVIGIASSGGLLLLILIFVALYKCGFFKRKKFGEEGCEEDEDDFQFQGGELSPSSPMPEGKPLMDEEEQGPKTNGSSSPADDPAAPSADSKAADGDVDE
ncbi:integrin alpha-M-like [Engraulis encrasicolus]|uniref:integrin alpha-M-like n=1 Tax=Engraulis encrasicolus TaxID=184585 RepID=UPI002FD032BF